MNLDAVFLFIETTWSLSLSLSFPPIEMLGRIKTGLFSFL